MAVNRVRITGPDMDAVRVRLLRRPKEITDAIEPVLREVADDTKEFIKRGLLDAKTPTGIAAQAKGLRPTAGRQRGPAERKGVRTISLYDAVRAVVTRGPRQTSVRFGWIYGTPGYSIYQLGNMETKYGIHLLADAKMYFEQNLKSKAGI